MKKEDAIGTMLVGARKTKENLTYSALVMRHVINPGL